MKSIILSLLASSVNLVAADPDSGIKVNYDEVSIHHGGGMIIPVLSNDWSPTEKILPETLAIEEPPQAGKARVIGGGRIEYRHTAGTPKSDSFKYRVAGDQGASGTATVKVLFSSNLRFTNLTLDVPANPPGTAYQFVDAFSGIAFREPTNIASPPGDRKRLFVLEKNGLMKLVPDVTAKKPSAGVFLDLKALLESRGERLATENEQGLLGLAFHPDFNANGWLYLFYSVIKVDGSTYERVARFTAGPDAADPSSEQVLIEQFDHAVNHQGSSLRFGPDGYLYISLGDEGGQNDQFENTQRINKNFFSGILRIDVDRRPDNLEPNPHPSIPLDSGVARYRVPKDNPFVHRTLGGDWNGKFNGVEIADPATVRTEFWATGLRNPWQIWFDPATGELWVGDVGGGRSEEVNIVTKGGNYGWPYREGFGEGVKKPKPDESEFKPIDPIVDYPHGTGTGQGNSITGGLIYQGDRLPALKGSYLYTDYASGNLWSLRRVDGGAPSVTRVTAEAGITAFAQDPSNGDLLAADYNGKRLLRLVAGQPGTGFPRKLSETRLFVTTADLVPAPGVIPYVVNHPAWNDSATARHWFVIPDDKGRVGWSRDGVWTFPRGMIWVQQLDLGDRRVETRLLVKNDAGSYGVSYRWDDDQQDATLVGEAGEDLTIITSPPRPWHVPGQAECMVCHSPQAGYALSFNTRQLNTASGHPSFAGNQLDLLAKHGYFSGKVEPAEGLPKYVSRENESAALDERARSYLGVNCANCHQAGGLAPTPWDLRPEIPFAETGLLIATGINTGGDPANKPLVPGDPSHSLFLHRMNAANGFQRMPLLGTSTTDQAAVDLLTRWINELPAGR